LPSATIVSCPGLFSWIPCLIFVPGKKQNRQLPDLEPKARSPSASLEQTPAEKVPSQKAEAADAKKRIASNPDVNPPQVNDCASISPSAEMFANHGAPSFFAALYSQLPVSTVPSPAYSNGSSGTSHALRTQYPLMLQVPYPDFPPPDQDVYSPPLPLSQPTYGSYGAGAYAVDREDETVNNFNFSYSSMEGIYGRTSGFNGDYGG
jgi:hypothetical protein